MNETYERPKHGWTCFHCGETFTTPGLARVHFGETPNAQAGCVLNVQVGAERGLLMALRRAEETLAAWMDEGTALHQQVAEQQSRQSEALRDAEELGYERGLRDAARGAK